MSHRACDPAPGCRFAPTGVKGFCVVMPARNEYPTVGELVRRILDLHDCEVVVVDDASGDGTGQAARAAGATVLRLPARAGAWRAAQTGLGHALARGYDTVVTFDADGQHLPETIAPVLDQVADGRMDVCIGSCPQRAGFFKKAAWSALRALSGSRVRDLTSGLRAYSRAAVEALLTEEAARLDYQDVGVLVLLAACGFAVGEVGVPMGPRRYGRSRQFGAVADMSRHFVKSALLCLLAGRRPRPSAERLGRVRARGDSGRPSGAGLSPLAPEPARLGRSG